MTYKQFLLALAREWVTDHSGECNGSPTPDPSCGVSERAPSKDSPCRLSGKIKEHILEEIIPTGLRKKVPPESVVCSSRESAVKHGIVVIDALFPCTKLPVIMPITL